MVDLDESLRSLRDAYEQGCRADRRRQRIVWAWLIVGLLVAYPLLSMVHPIAGLAAAAATFGGMWALVEWWWGW